MTERDILDWGSGNRKKVKNPQERMKYWNDKTKAFLLTDKECGFCSGKLEWLGVLTFKVLKYQCTECYKMVNIRRDK